MPWATSGAGLLHEHQQGRFSDGPYAYGLDRTKSRVPKRRADGPGAKNIPAIFFAVPRGGAGLCYTGKQFPAEYKGGAFLAMQVMGTVPAGRL